MILCFHLQCTLTFINIYSDINNVGSIRFLSNVFIALSNFILICALVQPAMEIERATKDIFTQLTFNESTQFKNEFLLTNIPNFAMYQQLAVFKNFSLNNEFLFLVIATCLSFLTVLLQFEIESTKVVNFNVFDV